MSGFAFESTALWLSRAALVGLLLLFGGLRLAGASLSLGTQAAVYLVGTVALNLPHGGYEHFANLRRRATAFRWRYVAGYLALAGASVGLFLVGPVVGLALAVGVAVAFRWLVPNPLANGSFRFGAVAFWSVLDRGRGIWHVP
jgi:hypothetical protein